MMKINSATGSTRTLTKHAAIAALVLIPTILSGCAWVKKTPEAVTVRTVPADRVGGCVSMGSVTTKTVGNISIVSRSAEKVVLELETLAQNEAAEIGADTIVATSKVVDGRRTFAMYKCLK